MEDYLMKLINRNPKENKGYVYVTSTEIAVPILCFSINAIKRKEMGLQLAEEIIMKLLDRNITTVYDIADIMGLEEELINISIGNLFVKDLINVTSGNCVLTTKGREVLKNLKEIKLEPENLSPIYINLITGEIYTDKFSNQTDKHKKNDNILKGKIKVDKEYIDERFSEIRDIFNEQQKIYGGSNLSPVQLYKIESIVQDKIQYLNVRSDIFKSKSGDEIEVKSEKDNIINQIQGDILEQIISGKCLRYLFKNNSKNKNILDSEIQEFGNYNNEHIKNLINIFNKINKEEQQEVVDEFYKIYKNERALLDNELEIMIEELIKNANNVDIYSERLADIIFNYEYMNPICKAVKKGTKVYINYNYDANVKKSKQNAEKTFPEIKNIDFIENKNMFENIVIKFDNSFQIETSMYDIKVLNGKYITKSISIIKAI